MVAVVSVAVSMQVASVGSTVALLLRRTLEAESAAAAVESALAERTSQVGFQTLPAQGPGSLHLGDRHPGSQSTKDDPIES